MEAVKTGRHHRLSVEAEAIGTEIAIPRSGWERYIDLKVVSHEQARQEEPPADI
jgi:hypothetical protein